MINDYLLVKIFVFSQIFHNFPIADNIKYHFFKVSRTFVLGSIINFPF